MDTYHKRKFKFGILGDPDQMYDFYFTWLLSKLHEIFVWENLPDGVDETFLNNCLFLDGSATFFAQNGKIYAMNCGLGGGIDEYYRPTTAILANPVLGSKQMKIGEECVVMWNTKNDEEAIKIYDTLKDTLDITLIDSSSRTFSRKLVVIPVYMAKGLEFDSVIIYTDKNNKYTDKEKYLYYVAITRCQHKLIVYNQ